MKHLRTPLLVISLAFGLFWLSHSAGALTITQQNIELNAKPGDVITKVVDVYDESLAGLTVFPAAYNFRQDATLEGSSLLITDPADMTPDHEWLKFDIDKIELPKDATLVPLTYRIEVPPDAEPGTHLIALAVRTTPPEISGEGVKVTIGTIVASNIFLKVAGATVDSIDVDFKVGLYGNHNERVPYEQRKDSFKEQTFFQKPPVDFFISVRNTGNTHQKPDGNIAVRNDILGTSETIPVNSINRIILPTSERSFEVESFGQGFMFGKYRAKLTLLYSKSGKLTEATKQVSFWIVPVVELSIVLGSLLLLIILILIIRKLAKRQRIRQEQKKEAEMRERVRREVEADLAKKQQSTPPPPPPPVPPTPSMPSDHPPQPPQPTAPPPVSPPPSASPAPPAQ